MTKVYDNLDFSMVGHFCSILTSSGIACEIRNEAAANVAGEVPFTQVFPELWVTEDRDAPRARAIITEYLDKQASEPAPADWLCPNCGEKVDGTFGECWNCGTAAPESA